MAWKTQPSLLKSFRIHPAIVIGKSARIWAMKYLSDVAHEYYLLRVFSVKSPWCLHMVIQSVLLYSRKANTASCSIRLCKVLAVMNSLLFGDAYRVQQQSPAPDLIDVTANIIGKFRLR